MTLPLTVTDLVCGLDLDANGNETTSDLQSLEQDVLHVLYELLDSNPDDPGRGVGVDQYLSGTIDQLSPLAKQIENQLEVDDRIDTVSCGLIPQPAGSANQVVISIQIGVDGSVLGLQYGWSSNGGVVPLSPVSGGP